MVFRLHSFVLSDFPFEDAFDDGQIVESSLQHPFAQPDALVLPVLQGRQLVNGEYFLDELVVHADGAGVGKEDHVASIGVILLLDPQRPDLNHEVVVGYVRGMAVQVMREEYLMALGVLRDDSNEELLLDLVERTHIPELAEHAVILARVAEVVELAVAVLALEQPFGLDRVGPEVPVADGTLRTVGIFEFVY